MNTQLRLMCVVAGLHASQGYAVSITPLEAPQAAIGTTGSHSAGPASGFAPVTATYADNLVAELRPADRPPRAGGSESPALAGPPILLSGDLRPGYSEQTEPNQRVPIPTALWLFASGLLGMAVVGRRKST